MRQRYYRRESRPIVQDFCYPSGIHSRSSLRYIAEHASLYILNELWNISKVQICGQRCYDSSVIETLVEHPIRIILSNNALLFRGLRRFPARIGGERRGG